MSLQSITLHLLETVVQRTRRTAEVSQCPLAEALTTILAAVLPDAPADMQAELVRMTWLSDRELWAIARGTMSDEQQGQLRRLTELHARRPLTPKEQEGLETLRREYGG